MQDVYQALLKIRPLRLMRGLSQKKRYSNAPIVIRHSPKHATWRNMRGPTPEAFSIPRVCQQLLLNSWLLEGTWENPHGRKAFQMLKVWQDILEIGPLKELWEDPHRREAFQMFIVWQKLLEIRPLSKPTAEFYVVCRRVGWSGQPHLLTQKCNIKT